MNQKRRGADLIQDLVPSHERQIKASNPKLPELEETSKLQFTTTELDTNEKPLPELPASQEATLRNEIAVHRQSVEPV